MNIELKQAAQRALLALRNSQPHPSNPFIGLTDKDFIDHEETINALHAAIQQAEVQKPATGEPVVEPFVATYSSESIGGKQHDTGRVNKGPRGDFFASTASVEDASLIADALNAYTHPAPSVLKDDQIAALVNKVRDIARTFHDHQSLRERIAIELVPALRTKQKGHHEHRTKTSSARRC